MTSADQPVALAPLPDGTIVGSYVVLGHLGTQDDHNIYITRVASDDEAEFAQPKPTEPHLLVIEAAAGTIENMRMLEDLRLRHPRLLALRDFFTQEDRDYLAIDLPGNTWPMPARLPLTTEEALAVGVIIGEVIAFLHAHGIAHGHLTPQTVTIAANGVFLAGVEGATIATATDPAPLFREDARQLGLLVGTLSEGYEGNPKLMAAVHEIAANAAAGRYERIEEIISDCLRVLPDGLPQLSEENALAPFTVLVGRATSVGMIRQQNQDAVGILSMEILDDQPEASPGGIFLVADGMGGEASGEVASRIAARVIVAEVARRFLSPAARAAASDAPRDEENAGEAATRMSLDTISSLTEAFRAANSRIRNLARRIEKPTGTTATALMFFAHEAVVGHVGDSRAYLLRGEELVQLTHDHSLIQRLIDIGQYNPDGPNEVAVPRNYLYRSLGQLDDLEVDTRVVKTGIGDSYMICSDGLWDLVPNEGIREVLTNAPTPQEAAEELVRRANAAGGYDNSTALV
ncbi:MAG: protein phosphatase 2C domain-containing protein, partial [Ktedonobacterales bacterium]|nr:protein phosphatase 2C domain-containing protein [Ktedonobacterales bacterium]